MRKLLQWVPRLIAAACVAAVAMLPAEARGQQGTVEAWHSWIGGECAFTRTTGSGVSVAEATGGCMYTDQEVPWGQIQYTVGNAASVAIGREVWVEAYNDARFDPWPLECDGEGDERWCRGGPDPQMGAYYFDAFVSSTWATQIHVRSRHPGAPAAAAVVFDYVLDHSITTYAGIGDLTSSFRVGVGAATLATTDVFPIRRRTESAGRRTYRMAVPFTTLLASGSPAARQWSLSADALLSVLTTAESYPDGTHEVGAFATARGTLVNVTVVDAAGRSLNGRYGIAAVGGPVYAAIVTPEPATVGLVGAGLLALAAGARRRRTA